MNAKTADITQENVERLSVGEATPNDAQDLARQPTKVNRAGIALVPQPTDDPRDPLVGGSWSPATRRSLIT